MKRPVGVTILAILALIGGVVNVILALPYLGVSTLAIPAISGEFGGSLASMALFSGIFLAVLGIVQLAFGVGALRLSSWAWTLGVIAFSVNLVWSVFAMFTIGLVGGVVLSALIAAGVIAYLYTHDVRTAFDHEDGSLLHSGHHTPMSPA